MAAKSVFAARSVTARALLSVSIGAMLAFGVAGEALAQAGQLEEGVVVAGKREESLQKVPLAITAVSSEMLQKNKIDRIDDLSSVVPSVQVTQFSTNHSIIQYEMRGFVQTDFILTADSPVAIYVDGVFVPSGI